MLKQFWPLLALSLCLLGPAPAGAAPPAELDAVVGTLEKSFGETPQGRAIRDFHARFRQTAHIASLDRVREGAGEVWVRFASGGGFPSFRWEYREPEPQLMVSDGRTVSVYLPENRQVIVSDVGRFERADDPLLFLTALGDISREFRVSAGEPWRDEEGNFLLDLVPKQPSPYFQRLRLKVPRQAVDRVAPGGRTPAFPLREVTVFDTVGNTTRIEFRQVETNLKPDPELFRFEPPSGVEVVRPGSEGSPF